MRETHMRDECRKATGDETITNAAIMRPAGAFRDSLIGIGAGALLGTAVAGDSIVSTAMTTAGGFTGWAVAGLRTGLPQQVCVAVSPTTVYLVGIRGELLGYEYFPFAQIPRDKLKVTVEQKLTRRQVTLEALETGAKVELEFPALNFYHADTVVELLMLSKPYHEPEMIEDALVRG